jgi:tetratricopeptide (TPR) repeat protein
VILRALFILVRVHMSTDRKLRRRKRASQKLYEIVYGPLDQLGHISSETRSALGRLYTLVRDDPRAAVTELPGWIEREPLPIFYNWLSVAYAALGEFDAVRNTVRENYRRNPRYLFARANYAQQCLRDGDLAGMREALGESLDLRPLLGTRKRVHVSEVAAYFYAVARYHMETGDRPAAESAYELMVEVAWEEPRTRELGRLLYGA